MRIYEVCKTCGNDTFEVYKEEGELGTYEECSKCGSNNIGFKSDVNVLSGDEEKKE